MINLSPEDKLNIIIETSTLTELEIGEYCRKKGIYPEQISSWRNTFVKCLLSSPSKIEREQIQRQRKTISQLETELNRKDKALAEVTALLVLQKKFNALMEGLKVEKSIPMSAKI